MPSITTCNLQWLIQLTFAAMNAAFAASGLAVINGLHTTLAIAHIAICAYHLRTLGLHRLEPNRQD